jgi:hypothetical protein
MLKITSCFLERAKLSRPFSEAILMSSSMGLVLSSVRFIDIRLFSLNEIVARKLMWLGKGLKLYFVDFRITKLKL